jgi:uncharacterized protein YcsI (UPF0317 family)
MAELSGKEIRRLIRDRSWEGGTVGRAGRLVQTGLVVLPQSQAGDFARFCERNPRPCPVLETTDPGDPDPRQLAPGADIRRELGSYAIWRHGEAVEEVPEIVGHWREDSVAFMIGSSLTFSHALEAAGCRSSSGINMYRTTIPCRAAGPFAGSMVVTMRTLPAELVATAVRVTERFPKAHGAPIHIGDPADIGIRDLSDTFDAGPSPRIPEGHESLFWACSVTPQLIAREAKIEFMITHSPGHGFVTDLLDSDLEMA